MKHLVLVVGTVVCLGGASALQAQTLADVARQAEAERAARRGTTTTTPVAVPVPTKVYTNANLVEDPTAPKTTTTDVGTAVPVAPAPITGTTVVINNLPAAAATGGHDEAYWKDRMRVLRADLDRDQTFEREAAAREKPLNVQVHRTPESTDYIRDRLQLAERQRQWQDTVAEVGRLHAAVANDQRAITQLQDEARRASVPPGWLLP